MATKVFEKLMQVQSRLRAPKDCENKFGGYKYRKAEDILEAVKPLLAEVGAVIRIDDTIQQVGDRFYVRANTAFIDITDGECVCTCAFAREPLDKKGMDAAQVTGATSSYARKYALNGLLAIDDSADDPDVTNKHGKDTPAPANATAPAPAKKYPSPLGKQAWAAFRALSLTAKMTDAQRSASFLNLVKEQTGKVESSSLTDDEWGKVITHIDNLAAL